MKYEPTINRLLSTLKMDINTDFVLHMEWEHTDSYLHNYELEVNGLYIYIDQKSIDILENIIFRYFNPFDYYPGVPASAELYCSNNKLFFKLFEYDGSLDEPYGLHSKIIWELAPTGFILFSKSNYPFI